MKLKFLTGFENKQSFFFISSPVIHVHFMNGVSDITFPRPLSTQDKHICCMVIAAKKKKEREKEGKIEGREGRMEI